MVTLKQHLISRYSSAIPLCPVLEEAESPDPPRAIMTDWRKARSGIDACGGGTVGRAAVYKGVAEGCMGRRRVRDSGIFNVQVVYSDLWPVNHQWNRIELVKIRRTCIESDLRIPLPVSYRAILVHQFVDA